MPSNFAIISYMQERREKRNCRVPRKFYSSPSTSPSSMRRWIDLVERVFFHRSKNGYVNLKTPRETKWGVFESSNLFYKKTHFPPACF